ncbi:hypothetical protein M440DRAFT_270581 [Trichoderma longibrachiatum ATCC 18648]|uniref:Uncharacterized protein n=1 Tax=Trichoderma longibrachiatum ATCC 18648 TaxID=983965 RepID=A0A2T4CBD0_TRILO|nr:hypothetical protein M440DRAFT_270581 [Trichoderma longibrachiatum ATCC 18648]
MYARLSGPPLTINQSNSPLQHPHSPRLHHASRPLAHVRELTPELVPQLLAPMAPHCGGFSGRDRRTVHPKSPKPPNRSPSRPCNPPVRLGDSPLPPWNPAHDGMDVSGNVRKEKVRRPRDRPRYITSRGDIACDVRISRVHRR